MTVPVVSLSDLFEQATALLARGEPGPALQCARQAWLLNPGNADICNLIGVCAIALGDRNAAEQCWQHAIALYSATVDAHYNLAMLYAESARHADAERAYRQTLAIAPDHAGAHARLGLLMANVYRAEEAEQCYRRALDLNRDDAATHCNLGLLLAKQKRDLEAEQSYRQAIALNPANAEAHANLGLLLAACNRMEDAEEAHRKALGLHPHASEIHSNLANLMASMERIDEAEQHYMQAIALDPGSAIAHSNLGVLLAYAGRDAEAESCFRQALALKPDYQLGRLNLGMLLLAQGRLGEGWIYHEARYHPDLPNPDAPMPMLPFKQWQGESLEGKSLLVWPEQGLGDMIQFCRYLPLLKKQGATAITLVCRQALLNLMETLEGVDSVISVDTAAATDAAHDYWTLPMSLPLHCHTELSSIPASIPYLQTAPERRAKWTSRLQSANNAMRVGLMWKGNPMHANDAKRSLPGIAALSPLWTIPDICFVSLQTEAGNVGATEHGLLDLGHDIGDFADTAAILEQLDLLITVDTAAAHVAGALGKRCWVLLPSYRTDWRWMRNRNDSPWYPDNMRLFRQSNGQDWDLVIGNVALALREHSAQGRSL